MRVQIAARHCDIPDSLRQKTESKLSRLLRYEPRLASADVVFEEEKHNRRVEVVLSVDGGQPVVARADADRFVGALDRVVDRLSRQLRRARDQARDHQASRAAGEVTAD